MLILHPRIYLDARGETSDALLVRQGRVVATGEAARAQAAAHEQVLKPEGACLFPALIDAHAHPWGLFQRANTVDLSMARSTHGVYERLREADPSDSPSGWLLGLRWDQHAWEDDERLDLAALDALHPGVPICLTRVDHHAVWCNSEALRRAGIVAAPGARAGMLVDDAMAPVLAVVPAASEAEDEAVFIAYMDKMRAMGVRCAHMAWMSVARVAMVERMRREGTLAMRLVGMIDAHDPELGAWMRGGPRHDPDGWFSAACIKFFSDGAMGSRGAWMMEPYLDGSVGQPVTGPEELQARLPALMEAGWQVAVHAIGDEAARQVLLAMALASDAARLATRPRLEHAQIITPESIQQLRALEVIASIQPIHHYSDAPWAHRVLAPHQLDRLYRWRDLADAGVRLAAGSDHPIDDPNPWHGVVTAITRRHARGETFTPEQALTREEILLAYTEGAAFAAGWEHQQGHLRAGALADVIALDHDPLHCHEQALWDMRATLLELDDAR